jgi:hypothetical protein
MARVIQIPKWTEGIEDFVFAQFHHVTSLFFGDFVHAKEFSGDFSQAFASLNTFGRKKSVAIPCHPHSKRLVHQVHLLFHNKIQPNRSNFTCQAAGHRQFIGSCD